jgi:diguanylate cyclase (GGDEF)-like protein
LIAWFPARFDLMRWARDQKFVTDVSLQIVIINKAGMLAATTLGMPSAPMDLSDREHFRVHVDTDRDTLFISKPIFGRVSNKWSIQLSRRIIARDGSFAGDILVSLDPNYLANFYESIDVRKDGMVLLVGLDGIVRARASAGDRTIGQSIASGALFSWLARASSGSYVTNEGVQRLASYRQVKGYPLVVAVGFARAEVFAEVERRRMIYYGMATFVSILVLTFAAMIVRHQIGLQSARDKLWEAANFDSLTKLPNRNRLQDMVTAIIADPGTQQERFAVLLLDLDNFKIINDTLGHEAGDLVLRTAAKRIKRMSREAHVVVRLGGDEFAVLLRGGLARHEVEETALHILREIRRKIEYRGRSIEMSISIGIACFPEHAATWSDIFRAADLALYRAKQLGRNRAIIFESTMLVEAENKLALLESVRSAIQSDVSCRVTSRRFRSPPARSLVSKRSPALRKTVTGSKCPQSSCPP